MSAIWKERSARVEILLRCFLNPRKFAAKFFSRGAPTMGLATEKQKRIRCGCVLYVAGRAGFEYHPFNGDSRLENKNTPFRVCFCLVAGRAGFEYHPFNGDARLENKNAPMRMRFCLVAGREGFEPATGFTQHSLSRRAHSATLAPPQKFVVATL